MLLTVISIFFLFILFDIIFFYINTKSISSLLSKFNHSNFSIRYISAFFCYLFMTFLLYYFVLINKHSSNKQKQIDSFLLGMGIYGVYETTNYSILENWSLSFVIKDILWGGILYLLVCSIILYFKK